MSIGINEICNNVSSHWKIRPLEQYSQNDFTWFLFAVFSGLFQEENTLLIHKEH